MKTIIEYSAAAFVVGLILLAIAYGIDKNLLLLPKDTDLLYQMGCYMILCSVFIPSVAYLFRKLGIS